MNNKKSKFKIGDFVKVVGVSGDVDASWRSLNHEPLAGVTVIGKYGIVVRMRWDDEPIVLLADPPPNAYEYQPFEETHLELVARA